MLSQPHASRGHAVEIGRADFRLAEAADVAITEVVGEDENDVGFGGLRGRGGAGEKCDGQEGQYKRGQQEERRENSPLHNS
jgi:hypothetical protein